MAEKNRFSKPVAFNKTNENDQMILKHVSRRNFSGYVKKLILNDIKVGSKEKGHVEPANNAKKDEPKTAAERLAELRETITKNQ